ncbi:hypothetical protein C8R48DRAFT_772663 [Suillus tomentosus]|nr:hypothetical protein C8R48DRAFT_772663 [Suillus tomentosus]
MLNITPDRFSTSHLHVNIHILEIEPTEIALRSWLQTQGTENLPDSLFITASVLFGSVDPYDLISLLDMGLRELAMQTQLQREEESMTVLPVQRGRCFMEERMYRAQMEVSLFSKAMANLCEKLNTTDNSTNSPTSRLALKTLPVNTVGYVGACQEFTLANFDCSPPTRYKCMAWLSSCRKASLLTSSHFHDVAEPGDQNLYLPGCLKALVNDLAYRAYVSASITETSKSPVRTDNSDSFKTEPKPLDELKSEFRIMYFKKQRAQAEVDMFAEAIARIVVEGTSAGSATTLESRPSDNIDDWFDDWNSASSSSSSASALLPVYPDFRRREPSPDSPTTQHVTRMQARRAVNVSNNPVSAHPLPQSSSSSSYPYPYPSDGTFPITPPRPTTTFSNASTRIPDFVQMLEHAQQPFPVIPSHVIRRVIMIVEIKPQSYVVPGGVFKWETIWKDQVQEQVLHAFEADRTLKYLGVLIAAGRRWVYSTVNRGKLVSRTMSEMRDPTWRGTGPQVLSSDNSVVEEGDVQPVLPRWNIPDFLPKAENGTLYQFDLLDARGDSLRAFQEIVNDLRHKNSDIWF